MLKVKNLTKRFGKLTAVNDLTFQVNGGEIFGIAGPNGAGKTTLFNLISGIYKGQGEIFFKDQQIDGLKPHQICQRNIARIFQVPTVFSSLSVYDNVRVGAHFGNKVDTESKLEILDTTLDFVGLKKKKALKAKNLSLLDKKLTMLATALATRPRILLLDEPIGGLSPTEINLCTSLFQRINKELKITLIVIEHLMKVLIELSNKLMILHNGQKIAIGSPSEVANDKKVIEVYLGDEYA